MEMNCIVDVVYKVYGMIRISHSSYARKEIKSFDTEEEALAYKEELENMKVFDYIEIHRKIEKFCIFGKELIPEKLWEEFDRTIE